MRVKMKSRPLRGRLISQPDSYLNSLSGHLMYVDSIYAKTFKEVAKLVSPMTTVPMSGCLSFQYQRSEERGNLFSVFTRDRLGQYQELWRAGTENQSDWSGTLGEWIPVQVDLQAPYSIQVSTNMSCQRYVHSILKHYVITFT